MQFPNHKLFNRWFVFLHDLLVIPLAWITAYWMRFNLETIPPNHIEICLTALIYVIPAQAAVFWYFGLYRGVWRFASLPDLIRITRAVLAGLLMITVLDHLLAGLAWVPRSVPLIYSMLLLFLLSAPRYFYRWIKEHRFRLRGDQRILIVGAGRAGEMLLRDLMRQGTHKHLPVAFVDDDPRKMGKEIHGVRVLGRCDEICRLTETFSIDLIMLAIPSASTAEMRRLVNLAEECGVTFRTVPQLDDVVSGRVGISECRPVSIEDLLGRKPIRLDWAGIRAGLTGKVILVSGAGGSIGSELCRQIARLEPASLILLENSEHNLYTIDLMLREHFPNLWLHSVLGDVSDAAAVERVFATHRPHLVFHAAAFKHVPMLEGQIREAVRNNVLGTREMANAASRYGCGEFVLISTDKAVNPANVMGATKRIAEIYCQNLDGRSDTRFITVRFGNVLGSAGSVVPRFQDQIRNGGPVTVTHPEIERYFMTVREACQLIMQAGVIGEGGEIFVLDMGEPIRIRYLAEQMIRLSGQVPERDIRIEYTGLRPGEKLYEELFHEREQLMPTGHDKIRLARHREMGWDLVNQLTRELEQASASYDLERLWEVVNRFVPERKPLQQQQNRAEVVPLRP